MDQSQLLGLGKDLLLLISPLVAQGALAKIGESTADTATRLLGRAWSLLQARFQDHPKAAAALTLYEDEPHDQGMQQRVADQIATRFKDDPAAITELQELVRDLRAATGAGHAAPGRTHQINVSGNARVGQAVAGDVHGGITVGRVDFGDIVRGDKQVTEGPKILGPVTAQGNVTIGTKQEIASAAVPPTAPVVQPRAINVWIGDSRDRPQSLVAGRASPLHVQVGDPVRASLVFDPRAVVPPNDIPPEGLASSWTIMARGLRLEAPPGEPVEVSVAPDDANMWVARFGLLIPQADDSAVRTLLITPLHADLFVLDVLIQVRGELYRQLQVQLDARAPVVLSAAAPAPLAVSEVVHVRADQIGLRSPHEWQREPGVLRLTVLGNQALVDADLATVDSTGAYSYTTVRRLVEWSVVSRSVEGLIADVRAAADAFRAVRAHEIYLNDIDAADLASRLAAFQPTGDWGALPNQADPAHVAAWEQVSRSKELRALARLGYQLYNRFFPIGGTLRPWMDGLAPGHRLNLTWTANDAGWMPAVPWGLLYRRDPGAAGPIDPLEFFGLRFRIDYTGYAAQGAPTPKHLGRPDQAHCGHLLYWGGQASDATAAEAQWLRGQLGALPQQVFVPAEPPGADRKQELLTLLEQPAPRPMALLYLFCQCDLNDGANQPLLRFGSTRDNPNILTLTDLPAGPLPDRSLVFANACTTVAGTTTLANELPQHFFDRGCSAFLGTEVRVPIAFASRFAAIFFHFFYRKADQEHQPMAAGEAVAQTRLFLWSHYRNIGGIFYTYINQYELFLADEQEIRALRS